MECRRDPTPLWPPLPLTPNLGADNQVIRKRYVVGVSNLNTWKAEAGDPVSGWGWRMAKWVSHVTVVQEDLGLPPPCATCSQAHPPPGVDVGNVHEGVVFLQGLIFIENLHLEGGRDTMGTGSCTPAAPLAARAGSLGGWR